MTVIAWDGKTIAADKQSNYGNTKRIATKLFRANDCIIGFAGNVAIGQEVVDWFTRDGMPKDFPPQARDKEDFVSLLIAYKTGCVSEITRSPFPDSLTGKVAIGSGRDFALAAMHLGKSAVEAVEVAALFDVNCGMGYDAYTLENQVWRKL